MSSDIPATDKQIKYARYLLYQYGEYVYEDDELKDLWEELDVDDPPSRERVSEIIDDLKEAEHW